MSTVHLVMSGKGGVGKSTLSAGLGIALSASGRHVCILDTDIGLRGQDALLGLQDNVIFDSLDVI
ncbi:MAG: P-loop NTPase, partial [Clostridia bacterium]|nr:P-loop NTPase [Clostridia bacterium]